MSNDNSSSPQGRSRDTGTRSQIAGRPTSFDFDLQRARAEMRLEDQAVTGAVVLAFCLGIVVIAVGILAAVLQ